MPGLLGLLHGRFATPHAGIWILVAISAALGIFGANPHQVDNLTQITLASNTGTFLVYGSTCIIALIAFASRHDKHPIKHYVIPGLGALMNIAELIGVIYIAVNASGTSPGDAYKALGIVAVWAIIGVVWVDDATRRCVARSCSTIRGSAPRSPRPPVVASGWSGPAPPDPTIPAWRRADRARLPARAPRGRDRRGHVGLALPAARPRPARRPHRGGGEVALAEVSRPEPTVVRLACELPTRRLRDAPRRALEPARHPRDAPGWARAPHARLFETLGDGHLELVRLDGPGAVTLRTLALSALRFFGVAPGYLAPFWRRMG